MEGISRPYRVKEQWGCSPPVSQIQSFWLSAESIQEFGGEDVGGRRTINSREQDSGVVVGNHVGISVLWFVHLQVGVFPRELLTGVNGL